MELNDSPEIPDRGETSDIPSLPSGVKLETEKYFTMLDKKTMEEKTCSRCQEYLGSN